MPAHTTALAAPHPRCGTHIQDQADASAVGGLAIAGGVGSIINLSFSSIIIGVYELM